MSFLKNKYTYFPAYIALIILAYIILFAHLERLPLHVWDEAHRGVNAQEIIQNNEWLVVTYGGQPDLYGTKPPMLVWTQALLMKIVGQGELAVRLPSALAGLGICLILFISLWKYLKNKWIAIIAVLVMLSSYGFITRHGARSGDTDVLMTFFSLLFALNFFRYLEFKRNKYIYYASIFLALATLTKSVAVFMFAPGLLLYILYKKKFSHLLQNKHFYYSGILFFVMVCAYYINRELKLPGYLSAVWENEFAGRYLEANDGHTDSFWFYLRNLADRFVFSPVLIGIPLVWFIKDERKKKAFTFSFVLALSFLSVISLAQTKLMWYDIPTFPFWALMIAVIIYIVIDFIRNLIVRWVPFPSILMYAMLVLLFFKPISASINTTFNPELSDGDKKFFRLSNYLRDKIDDNIMLHQTFIVDANPSELHNQFPYRLAHVRFYTNILNERGSNIGYKSVDDIKIGDNLLVKDDFYKEQITSQYKVEVNDEYFEVCYYTIIDPIP